MKTRYEHTEIFVLKSVKDVMVFCRRLFQLKREAPWSLLLTVAVTATREVQFRGSGKPRHVGEELQALSRELEGSDANPLPIGKPSTEPERRSKRRRRTRRKPDPKGY